MRERRRRLWGAEFSGLAAVQRGGAALLRRPAALGLALLLGAGVVAMSAGPARVVVMNDTGDPRPLLLEAVLSAFAVLLATLCWLGLYGISLRALRGEPVRARDALPVGSLVQGAAAALLAGALAQVGLALLVLPGVLVYAATALAQPFVLDKGLGALAALQASWTATRGRWWGILVVLIVPALPVVVSLVAMAAVLFHTFTVPPFEVVLVLSALSAPWMAASVAAAYEALWPGARPHA
ncbi:MAG: hypothetical protein M9894_38005 [Planctomycetes bacterium]|nr:hypothetical protein [Planctomycetota bacterium]